MGKESMQDSSTQEMQEAHRPNEIIGSPVKRVDVLPEFLDIDKYNSISNRIPPEYETTTLAGELSRQFNPFVIGSSPSNLIYEGHGYEPTTREADFIGRIKNPIDVVDAIGGIAANYFKSYESMYGQDRLARMMAIMRSGQIARLPGSQRDEDEEILQSVDGLLASVRRFAATGRTDEAEDFARASRALVDQYGKLEYTPQSNGSIKRTMSVPTDNRVQGFERVRLEDIFPKLNFHTRRAYQYLARAHRLFGDAAVRIAIKSFPLV